MSAILAAIVAMTGAMPGSVATGKADQGLNHYLQLRRHYGIHVAADEPALESFVGMRVVEIAGVVNGSIRVKGRDSILLTKPNGQDLPIMVDSIPDFMQSGQVNTRLIVKAYRTGPDKPLTAHLLAAAPEAPIAKIESDDMARAEAAEAERARRAAQASRPGFHVVNPSATNRPHRTWVLPYNQLAPYYAAFIHRENPHLSNNKSLEIALAILGFSRKYGVDPKLIMAMVMVESDFDPNSTSNKGALGLGQLMPENVKDMGITNAYDTTENLYGTVRLVRQGLELYSRQTGDPYRTLVLTLAGYNAGDGAVRRHGGVPPYRETQAYVKRVIQLYRQFSGH